MADLAASEQFYAGLLGFPVVERWGAREAIWVMAGERTRIGLWRPQVGIAGGRGGAHVHYALQIAEDDYETAVGRLREAGRDVHEEDFSGYGHGRGRAAYVVDPDEHVVEFWTWDVSAHLREIPDR